MRENTEGKSTRRRFIQNAAVAGGAAASFTILSPERVFGSQANSKINVGIIGTGGRGTFDGETLVNTGKAQVVALADYFEFAAQEAASKFGVEAARCFNGLDGYKQLLALSDVDAVILTTPPFFRPEQFEAAVSAGKHVFAEKPIAVDPWGCRKFREVGEAAQTKKLTVVAGLQSRYDGGRQKIAQMIHEGAIGKPLVAHSQRMGGDLWRRERPAHFTERDHQIRHWLYYLWAGGDFIVEMHIHNLDIFNWFTGMLPVSATGHGGRSVRTDVGDIFDHINVLYEFPDGFHLSHTGTQISDGYQGSEGRIVGTAGYFDNQKGLVSKGKEPVAPGDIRKSTDEEMIQFAASVLGEGPYLNNSDYVTTSSFTTILGRTAAYRKAKVTWKELWDSNERIEMPV